MKIKSSPVAGRFEVGYYLSPQQLKQHVEAAAVGIGRGLNRAPHRV